MKIKIKSTHNPILLSCKTKTMIIGGTIEEVNGEPWDHDYIAVQPAGCITKDDIEWEPSTPMRHKLREWRIPSSNGCIAYTIRELDDGSLTCTCDGFYYRKKCKHVDAKLRVR